MKFSPDNRYLAVVRTNSIEVLNIDNSNILKTKIDDSSISNPKIQFDPVSTWLAYDKGFDHTVILWNLKSNAHKEISYKFTYLLLQYILMLSNANVILFLWDPYTTSKPIYLWKDGEQHTQLILNSGFDSKIYINRKSLKLISINGNNNIIIDLEKTKSQLVKGHSDKITACKFSDDGLLVTASADSSIKAWKATKVEQGTNYLLQWTSHHRFFARNCELNNPQGLSESNMKSLQKDNESDDQAGNEVNLNFTAIQRNN